MLIQDLINQGEKLEYAYTVLERHEGQIRDKQEAFNGFQLAVMIFSLVVNWKAIMHLTSCSDPFEYLEHRFNISVYCSRKYYRFAKILRNNRYLFEGVDYRQIKSVHMLDHFKRALENHAKETVMRALTTMSVREFERFSYRRPLYATTEDMKDSFVNERPESNRTSVFFDYSRYQEILTDAFKSGKEVLAIGTESSEHWGRILATLRSEGLELSEYEANSPHSSVSITLKKLLLS